MLISDYVEKQFRVTLRPEDRDPRHRRRQSEALDLAFRAVLNPGDEVIYHEPCYVSYSPSIKMAYGVPVVVEHARGKQLRPHGCRRGESHHAEDQDARVELPHQPTGGIMPPEELEKIAALAVKHDLFVFTDEIYCELLYDGPPAQKHRRVPRHERAHHAAPRLQQSLRHDRLASRGTPAPPPSLREAMMKVHQYCMLCAPIMSQIAGLEALKMGCLRLRGDAPKL
jgi:aminotransferase